MILTPLQLLEYRKNDTLFLCVFLCNTYEIQRIVLRIHIENVKI